MNFWKVLFWFNLYLSFCTKLICFDQSYASMHRISLSQEIFKVWKAHPELQWSMYVVLLCFCTRFHQQSTWEKGTLRCKYSVKGEVRLGPWIHNHPDWYRISLCLAGENRYMCWTRRRSLWVGTRQFHQYGGQKIIKIWYVHKVREMDRKIWY